MRSNVHFECAERYINFFTEFTTERLLGPIAGGAMELAVLREAGKCGVTFTAIGTLVSDALAPLLRQIFGENGLRRWRRGRRVGT